MITAFRRKVSVFVALIWLLMPVSGFAVIDIDAGDNTTICYGDNLDLSVLGAFISGDVDDGIWFSDGDGIFLPGGGSNVIFSIGTYYQPGPQDLANVGFQLILVSDDPDGNGPMVEVSDVVDISLMTSPPMVCNTSINISLSESCEQAIDVFMLMANPLPPQSMYIITLRDENGDVIPDNILTTEHVGQQMTYVVGHSCSSNTCDGTMTASDNIPPFINCLDATISCTQSARPEVTGLPIPFFATAVVEDSVTYIVSDFDACGDVVLTFSDDTTAMNCDLGLSSIIERYWDAVDVHGNTSNCLQTINIEVIGLDSVVAPHNYDNIDLDVLACDGDWERLPDGHPAPSHTGRPTFGGCTNIEANFSDLVFDQCGAGFKIARQWLVIDWCTSENFTINQIIKIEDATPPIYECPSDTVIGTDAYQCINVPFQAMFMEEVVECSEWDYEISIMDDNGIDQTAAYVNGLMIEGLGEGEYTLTFHLEDVCGNDSSCTTALTVVDDTEPFAICDQHTKVSLQSVGTARLFATSVDDASYDNCAIDIMEVQKMTDECGYAIEWSSYVDFCCEEVGDTVMVQFRVTDANGLSNTCMVEVIVEDKLGPEITCPTDITIACDYFYDTTDLSIFGTVRESEADIEDIIIYDDYNNGLAGQDGYFSDNCGATLSETFVENTDCGAGTIVRTFIVTDTEGNKDTCIQTITIFDNDLILEEDISWPENYFVDGCDTLQGHPDVAGYPQLLGDHCSQLAFTYEDQVFYLSGGACVKILRYWTALDWCQFDPETLEGHWTYVQEIKLFNTEAPQFSDCTDREICNLGDCDSHDLLLVAAVTDDCTDPEYLRYEWSLDIDNDGSIDASGITDTISHNVSHGYHHVYWTVTDGCGNYTDCDYVIEVIDCKLPTPYCLSSIATVVMPSTEGLTIWASDFDFDSYDNCTAQEDLIISFSENILDTFTTLTCADMPNGIAGIVPLEIWITDEAGNQDYCAVEIIIQDGSGDVCLDGEIKGLISGRVMTRHDEVIEEAMVRYDSRIENYRGTIMTNESGDYETPEIPEYLSYGVRPTYNGGKRNDVNSIDLVFIQRHILELDTLHSPYDLIAADVTGNERIQPSDLLQIRKYILEVIPEFRKVPKWEFVPSAYVFPDSMDPFGYQDSIEIDLLENHMDTANFVAIRMGNVQGGNRLGLKSDDSETSSRSQEYVTMDVSTEDTGDGYISSFSLAESTSYNCFQMSLECTEGRILSVTSDLLQEDDFHISDNVINIVNINLSAYLASGKELFSIVTSGSDIILRDQAEFKSFIADDKTQPLTLAHFSKDADAIEESRIRVYNNPFRQSLQFSVEGSTRSEVEVSVYTTDGNLVHKDTYVSHKIITLPEQVFLSDGMYFLEVQYGDDRLVEKVVRVQ